MNDSDKNRNEDPRLVLRRSLQTASSSSSSLSLDDTSPVGAGNSLNHSHDVNYNSAKRPGEKINHELGRKRSKSYSTAEDKEFVDLSPKAPSDSLSHDTSGDRSPPHQTVSQGSRLKAYYVYYTHNFLINKNHLNFIHLLIHFFTI